jgi:hypothetical protein
VNLSELARAESKFVFKLWTCQKESKEELCQEYLENLNELAFAFVLN